ncbi:hypothetical protein JCM7447_21320 [Corynebacterium amycolatum]
MSAIAMGSFLLIAVFRKGWRFTTVIARLLNPRWWSCKALTALVLLLRFLPIKTVGGAAASKE